MVEFFKNLHWSVKYPGQMVIAAIGGYVNNHPEIFPSWAVFAGAAVVLWVVLAFLWHALNYWRETHGRPRLRLEPLHIIILGLVIALGGVIWQMGHNFTVQHGTVSTTSDAVKRSETEKSATNASAKLLQSKLAEAQRELQERPKKVVKVPDERFNRLLLLQDIFPKLEDSQTQLVPLGKRYLDRLKLQPYIAPDGVRDIDVILQDARMQYQNVVAAIEREGRQFSADFRIDQSVDTERLLTTVSGDESIQDNDARVRYRKQYLAIQSIQRQTDALTKKVKTELNQLAQSLKSTAVGKSLLVQR